MTPLLGTKPPSAPVGDKSGGNRRAARAAAFQVFTKPETRDPRHGYRLARGASQREFRGFHETRITRHESRTLPPPGRCFPARCGAAWGGYGAAWAAAVPRSGNTACWVFTNHETRLLRFSSHDFPRFPGISRYFPAPPTPRSRVRAPFASATPPVGFLRDTNHESRPFFACFDLRMVRHAG